MPVITFLNDLLAYVKGPYHHKVGRHTVKFCSRAAKRAANDAQKRVWLLAAVSADEFVAALAGVDNKRNTGAFQHRAVRKDLNPRQATGALRVYLSALLLLISRQKQQILQKVNQSEQDFLRSWTMVFDYGQEDMKIFNDVLIPAFRGHGTDGLIKAAGELLVSQLLSGSGELTAPEMETLTANLAEDAAAIVGKIG